MKFTTPWRISNGKLLDRDFKEISLIPRLIKLPDRVEEINEQLNGINYLHVELDETALDYDVLDYLMEEARKREIYLGITPITSWCREADGMSEHAIRMDEPIRAERYLDQLFKHKNGISGRKFFEYENLAAIEPIIELHTFTVERMYAWVHHLRAFIEHYFRNRLLNIYLTRRGPVPEELHERFCEFGKYQPLSLFSENLRFSTRIEGLNPAVFTGSIREAGTGLWNKIAISEAASQHEKPHANGGAEGWCAFESKVPTELKLEFKSPVKEAKFRPSVREQLPVEVNSNSVELLLESNRYGMLEVNHDTPELPSYTVYIFNDKFMDMPVDNVQCLKPGFHRQNELKYTAAKTLYFLPGEHRIDDNRLRPVSDHDIYLAPGAVVKAGITCEDGHNIRIYGYGILDGTEVIRQPGENWKGRADDSFVHFFRGDNITFDGPVIFNSPFWNIVPEGTSNCTIRNHKAITWVVNTDGVQPRSCNNLLVQNCFFKCADDSIAVKTRRSCGMTSRNLVFEKLICFNDAGSCLEIGHTSQADLLEDVTFRNIECITEYSGSCHIHVIDHSTVRNVNYENIYVEQNIAGRQEINFQIRHSPRYSTDKERGRIENILIKNLHIAGKMRGTLISGFDVGHMIKNVTVDGVFVHNSDGSVERLGDIGIEGEFFEKIEVR